MTGTPGPSRMKIQFQNGLVEFMVEEREEEKEGRGKNKQKETRKILWCR